jgi:hypothetical protein
MRKATDYELKGWIAALAHTFFEEIPEEEQSPEMARRFLTLSLQNGQTIADIIRESNYEPDWADKIEMLADSIS